MRVSAPIQSRDAATPAKCAFSGTVAGIERDFRVILKDVRFESGVRLEFPAAVTLLTRDEGEQTPIAGQSVSGVGKFFLPEGKRNPGGQDSRLRNLSRGYWLSGYLIPGWTAEGIPSESPARLISALRESVLLRIDRLFGESAPLYRALLAGDRSEMDSDSLSSMRKAGIIHILTISGMHISILALAVSWFLDRFRFRGLLKLMLVVVLVGIYVLLAGFSVGTMRAFIMVFLRENAKRTGRKYDPLTALGIAYFTLTIYLTALVYTFSFQFSFSIVLGIHLIAPALTELLSRRFGAPLAERKLIRTIVFCIATQMAVISAQLADTVIYPFSLCLLTWQSSFLYQ